MTDYNLREVNDNPKVETAFLWDWEQMHLKLTIDAGKFQVDEKAVILFATCSEGSGFKRKDDYKWEWKEGEIHHLVLKFWQVSHEETDYKTKAKSTIEPHRIEKFMGYVAKQFGDNLIKGNLWLVNSSSLDMVMSGKSDKGVDLTEEFRDMMMSTNASFEYLGDDVESIWTDELCEKCYPKDYNLQKRSWGGGSKGQTEAERIADREKWLIDRVAHLPIGEGVATADDFLRLAWEASPEGREYQGVMDALKLLMG